MNTTSRLLINAILPILMTIIGVLGMVYGEIDDSPGLMLIGLLLILSATWLNIKNRKLVK